jgi:hypothetical protein
MKVALDEYEGCFGIVLTPETLEDAAKILRMGMNGTKEVRNVSADVYPDNTLYGYVTIGKRKQPTSSVRQR